MYSFRAYPMLTDRCPQHMEKWGDCMRNIAPLQHLISEIDVD